MILKPRDLYSRLATNSRGWWPARSSGAQGLGAVDDLQGQQAADAAAAKGGRDGHLHQFDVAVVAHQQGAGADDVVTVNSEHDRPAPPEDEPVGILQHLAVDVLDGEILFQPLIVQRGEVFFEGGPIVHDAHGRPLGQPDPVAHPVAHVTAVEGRFDLAQVAQQIRAGFLQKLGVGALDALPQVFQFPPCPAPLGGQGNPDAPVVLGCPVVFSTRRPAIMSVTIWLTAVWEMPSSRARSVMVRPSSRSRAMKVVNQRGLKSALASR